MSSICFLIRQLNAGGAQRQLIELAKGLDGTWDEVTVVTFYPGGLLEPGIRGHPRVRLINMGKGSRWDIFTFFARLVRQLRSIQPDVLHGYLGVSNLLCLALKPLLPGTRIVWGMRGSYRELDRYDWLERLTYRLEAALSRFPNLVIANSDAGRDYQIQRGFPPEKVIVIPNGVDTDYFSPDPDGRNRVRGEWGVGDGERLIGLVGRLNVMKDHPTFLRAASHLVSERDDVRFLCLGDGPRQYRAELERLAADLGISDRLIWSAARSDMPAVYSSLDLLALSSAFGEGFPNTVAEAMACGTPCVVTDTGDSRQVVGGSGVVVPPRDAVALAAGWKSMLSILPDQRSLLGEQARARVVLEFSTDRLVQRTSRALVALL